MPCLTCAQRDCVNSSKDLWAIKKNTKENYIINSDNSVCWTMEEIWLRVWKRGITHMVFYVRSWHWSCWCRLLLITADGWWLLLIAGWLLVASRIQLVAAVYWMIAADCRSAACMRKSLWKISGYWWFAAKTFLQAKKWIISRRRWRNLAKTSFKIVLEYFEEAMRKLGKDKF